MKNPLRVSLMALLLICGCTASLWAQKASLPFIDDDYAEALAQAGQRHVPLFVEVWAPW